MRPDLAICAWHYGEHLKDAGRRDEAARLLKESERQMSDLKMVLWLPRVRQALVELSAKHQQKRRSDRHVRRS